MTFTFFFEITYQNVVKSQQKFSYQSVKMSSYTSLSDHCNSTRCCFLNRAHLKPMMRTLWVLSVFCRRKTSLDITRRGHSVPQQRVSFRLRLRRTRCPVFWHVLRLPSADIQWPSAVQRRVCACVCVFLLSSRFCSHDTNLQCVPKNKTPHSCR